MKTKLLEQLNAKHLKKINILQFNMEDRCAAVNNRQTTSSEKQECDT